MSFPELMEEAYRLIARVRALHNKERSKKLACQSRSKLIPKNATIRKEFVKCKNLIANTNDMVRITTLIGKILRLKN
jgi:hypothetical protein